MREKGKNNLCTRKGSGRPGNKFGFEFSIAKVFLITVVSETTPWANAQKVIDFVTDYGRQADLEETGVVATLEAQLSASTKPEVLTEGVTPSLLDPIVVGIVVVEVIACLLFFLRALSSKGKRKGEEYK
jgi:hypothetical protein